MNKTLLISDTHLKPFRDTNQALSKWEFKAQKHCLDTILKVIQTEKPSKIIHLGDLLETSYPKNYELELLDYFFSNIPKGIELILISGNHELDRDSTKRQYYWEFMADFYKERYNLKVYDWVEINNDLYCSHRHINKLEMLNKEYRYVFSHIRSSENSKFIVDEINMASLKMNAKKVFLGDIHNHLEYDNIVYCGQSTWVSFCGENYEEDFDKVVPSILLLNEDNGEHTRVKLFDSESSYQKKYRKISGEEFEELENIVEEINQDCQQGNHFYKVRVYAKKFMIEKVRQAFSGLKHCVNLDVINLTFKDSQFQNMQINMVMKESLDIKSVSKNCLEYCNKLLAEPRLEGLLSSTYATLEGSLSKDKEGEN